MPGLGAERGGTAREDRTGRGGESMVNIGLHPQQNGIIEDIRKQRWEV